MAAALDVQSGTTSALEMRVTSAYWGMGVGFVQSFHVTFKELRWLQAALALFCNHV
jgi:hypothetical protein